MNGSELCRPILLNFDQILIPTRRFFAIFNISTVGIAKWMDYPKGGGLATAPVHVKYTGYYNKTDDSIYLLCHHGMGLANVFKSNFKQKKWVKLWGGLFTKLPAKDYPLFHKVAKLTSIHIINKECFIVAPKFALPEYHTWTDEYLWSLNLYKCDTSKHDHDNSDNPWIQKPIQHIAELIGTYSCYELHFNTVVTTKHDRKKNKLILIKQTKNDPAVTEISLSKDAQTIDLLYNKQYVKEALSLRADNRFIDAIHVRGNILLLITDSQFNGETLINIINLSPKLTTPTIKSYKFHTYWAFLLENIDREKLIIYGWIRKYNLFITMLIPDYLISIICKYYSLDTIILMFHADTTYYFSIISVDNILNQDPSENNEIKQYQARQHFRLY